VYIVYIPLINVKITAFCGVKPSHLQTGTNILEKHAASTFRANASSTSKWDERFHQDVAMYLPNYVASCPKGINFHRPHYENLKSYTINPLTA